MLMNRRQTLLGAGATLLSAQAGFTQSANGDVTIGMIAPMTGVSATIGKDQERGALLATREVNTGGGVLGGRNLVVQIEDSQGRVNGAMDAARKLVTVDEVPAIVATYSSGLMLPVGQYLQTAGVPHVNPGASSERVRGIGSYNFGVVGLDTHAGRFAVEEMVRQGWQRVAVVLPNNAFGTGMLESMQNQMSAVGGIEFVQEILYTEGRTDYRNEMRRLQQSDPDAYIYFAYGTEATTVNRIAFETGMQDRPWFGMFLSIPVADSVPETVEGQLGFDLAAVAPGSAYRNLYVEEFGEELISNYSGYVHDSVRLIAAAINQAGSLDRDAIRDALPVVGQDFPGATGSITFDEDGQRLIQPYALLSVQNGVVAPAQ